MRPGQATSVLQGLDRCLQEAEPETRGRRGSLLNARGALHAGEHGATARGVHRQRRAVEKDRGWPAVWPKGPCA